MEHISSDDQNERLVEDLRNIKRILIEDIISRRERMAYARELAGQLPSAEYADRIKAILQSELTLEEKANQIYFLEQSLRSDRC